VQSSQVYLFPKSEIFDGVAIYHDAEGVTFLGGTGGMLPRKFWKLDVTKTYFPSFWTEMWPFKMRISTVVKRSKQVQREH